MFNPRLRAVIWSAMVRDDRDRFASRRRSCTGSTASTCSTSSATARGLAACGAQ
jgi:hypothetical protein